MTYACTGGLVGLGAPLGLLGIRLARASRVESASQAAVRELATDPVGYLYVATSTAVAFTAFGYVLGRQADRLATLSETDALTGLCNARGWFSRLEAELARSQRYRVPLALLLIDLDHLKAINDQFGHRAGDFAIRRLSDMIRSQLRQTDVAARWGGDEFAILAPNTERHAAVALAERIRATVPERTGDPPVTASMGIATLDPAAGQRMDAATLMRAADAAMYQAKRRGRNMVVVASPDETMSILPKRAESIVLPSPRRP